MAKSPTDKQKRAAQQVLVDAGYDLGKSGPARNGVDGAWGQKSIDASILHLASPTEKPSIPPKPTKGVIIDPAAFRTFAPKALPGVLEAAQAAAQEFRFSPLVTAHWLGQMYVECTGFTVFEENLNYSAKALIEKFGRHRISIADANKFGRIDGVQPAHQNAIANIIYGGEWGRINLGNTQPGDGWKYRGGGPMQTTGRANYAEVGYEDNPEVIRGVANIKEGMRAAATFFVTHKCVQAAAADNVELVTQRVNGGQSHLAERRTATNRARSVVL